MADVLAAGGEGPVAAGGWSLTTPEWLEVHAEIVQVLAAADDLREASPQVLDIVGRALSWDVGAVWERDRAAGVLRCKALWTRPGLQGADPYAHASRATTFRPGEGLPGRVWDAVAPVWFVDLRDAPALPRTAALAEAGLRSALAFPVRSRDEVLGVIELAARTPRDPEAILLQALDAIGAQLGQFIQFGLAEERARMQAELLQAQGEASIDGIAVISPDGHIVSHNRRFLELWGLPADVVSRSDREALELAADRVADPEAFLARVQWLYEHPYEASRDEVRLRDGRVLDRHGVPLQPAPDTAPHRLWLFRDVTDDRRREEQQAYLAEAGAVLGAGLDQEATLRRIAELAVPQLADWAMVYLAYEDESIRRVAIAHRADDEHPAAIAAATLSTHPDVDPSAEAGVPLVIRTGRPQLHRTITPEAMAADAEDPDAQAAVLRELGLRSWICVPLTARGVTFGALSLVTADSGRVLGRPDLRFAEQVAHRAALALDNARRFGRSTATAEGLQRSLLPDRLPEVEGAVLAARYVPGSPGVAVGGDWYDALLLDDRLVGLAIGDVAGHGTEAAATMGQLRTALRAYTLEGHQPAEALARLEAFHESLDVAEVATALCLNIDVASGALTVAAAGHLPPLVVAADGTASLLRCPPGLPLGAGPATRRSSCDATLEPGATVLLYTDGLVERRGESIEDGLARLVAAARTPEPETLCDAVLEALVGGRRRTDDVAVVALHRVAGP